MRKAYQKWNTYGSDLTRLLVVTVQYVKMYFLLFSKTGENHIKSEIKELLQFDFICSEKTGH